MKYTKMSTEFESKSRDYQTRLEAYENIEKELDEVIMQAAEGLFLYFIDTIKLKMWLAAV